MSKLTKRLVRFLRAIPKFDDVSDVSDVMKAIQREDLACGKTDLAFDSSG